MSAALLCINYQPFDHWSESGLSVGTESRQIHPAFCQSGHVLGLVITHIPSLVPSVPIVPMGTHRLVCDGPRLWPPVEDCLDWSVDKSIQVSVGAAMSGGHWYVLHLALYPQYLFLYRWVHTAGVLCDGPRLYYGRLWRTAWIGL